jgi:hypothetical protein
LIGNMSIPDPAGPPPNPPGFAPPPQAAGAPPAPQARQIPLTANLSVDVSGGSVDNVQVELVPGVAIPGRIVIEGATTANPQRGLSVNLVREPDVVGIPNGTMRGMVQADGTFNLQNVGPGEYRVYVPPLISGFQWGAPNIPQGLQSMYVKSARLGNEDLLRSRVRVTGGTPPGQIEIVVGAGGRFSGNAMNDRREPVPNVTVVLVPDGASRQRRDLFRTTSTDISGRFSMQGVPAATYKAFAFEEVSVDAWQNAEFLRPLEGRGTSVEIRDGNQTSADIQVIPGKR